MKSRIMTCQSRGSRLPQRCQAWMMRQMFLLLFLIYLLLIPKSSCQLGEVEQIHVSFSISENAREDSLVGVVIGSRYVPPYVRWIKTQADNKTVASFDVDLTTGRITTRQMLNREEQDKHTIIIDTSSISTKLVVVEITVLDVNDRTPTFQNPRMTETISESAPKDAKISLGSVRDEDLGGNSTKTVEIISGNDDGAFFLQVRNSSNVDKILDLVVTAQQLDYETKNQNDNTPVFNTSKYSARIKENVTVETPVIKVEATDTDSDDNSRITYSIDRISDPEEYFKINARSGQITVNKPLDFETKPKFLLTLEARDNGNPPQLGTAVLDVIVENINEQPANITLTFEPKFQSGHIPENVLVDTLIATITVHDPDIEAKPNAETKLYGDKGDFELRVQDSKRGLYVKEALDRESIGVYELTIVVTDVGVPPLRANKEFKLIIGDINDNTPVFEYPVNLDKYTVELDETVEVGKEVIKVSASDSDIDANGHITYQIQDATSHLGWFTIDPATGVITTKATVDCELNPQPILTVVATDGGDPPKMATAQVVINIRDVNDNQPEFDTSFYSFTVAENRRVGDCIITVSASDPECGVSSPVVYQMSRTLAPLSEFKINSKTGDICIGTQLDYEETKSYQFQVEAVDSEGLSAEAVVQVEVIDVNDNHPRFEPRAYPINLTSRTKLGPLIFVQARDLDHGKFGTVTYSIINGNDGGYFAINNHTGSVSLIKSIPDQKTLYTLGVRATDGGGLTSKEPGEVRISFISGDVHPPIFSQTMFNFTVSEKVDEGHVVGRVEATLAGDEDSSKIQYSSIFQTEDWFTVHPSTGVITTKVKLDREQHPFVVISMHAEAHFPPTFAAAQVNVTILDVNDNPPVFPVTSMLQLDVREDEPVTSAIYFARAQDYDKGDNGKIRYRLDEGPHEMFSIDKDEGQITLIKELDYEKITKYILVVIAEDYGSPKSLSSNMTLTINVKDVNDNAPHFDRKVYNFYVSENVPPGHTIDTVRASDEDSDHNGRISYRFKENNYKSLFGISPIEGTVWTRGNLDRELHEVYELTVEAVDHGSPKPLSASALVRIYVTDMNDNYPIFSMDYYRFEIEENLKSGQVFGKVTATDADSGRNGKLRYSFANVSSEFKIDLASGDIQTKIPLDHEKSANYALTVLAYDEGDSQKWSHATVRINVLDVNDNAPAFKGMSSNRLPVDENKPKGTRIVEVIANDPDAGSNGLVTFFFDPEMSDAAALTNFQIHSRSGWITTSEVLDYEARQRYELVVVAKDGGAVPMESFQTLIIVVNDVIDQPPLFPSTHVDFVVVENTEINTVVGQVQAMDMESGENSRVSYSLVGGNVFSAFAVNRSTGVISTVRDIDYEASSFHNLSIQAVDSSTALPRSSNISVTITVLDINDNHPVFDTDPVFIRTVKEGTSGELIHTFLATDLDSSVNGTVRYSIQSYSGEDDEVKMGPFFDIDPDTGAMTVIKKIDYEKVNQISVIVKAEDLCPGCSLFSWLTTIVYVTDVNDNAPVFESASSISVPEDQAISYPILVVVAVDSDSNVDESGNNVVRYGIVAGNEDGKFHLAEDTGYLTIQDHLDYETKKSYIVNVSASDSGNPKMTSYQEIHVAITDVNDNSPIFLQTLYIANITENNDPQSFVTKVQARDADTGDNGYLTYLMPDGIGDDRFTVDEITGVVSTKKTLDREVKDSYLITVYVRDGAYPIHYSSCTVSIAVLDQNDNWPVFKQSLYTVRIPENLAQSSMLSVAASDKDLGDNARITYAITDGNDGHFTIDPENGHLSTEALDRETRQHYDLIITVSDRGSPALTVKATVKVTVIDENDNSPTFSQPVYTSNIREDVAEGTVVLTVGANDTDFGDNGKVTYSVGNDTFGLFEIDSQNGTVTTSGVFDREKRSNFSFFITATDHGVTGPRNSTARLDIEIEDVNDNAPVFTMVPYSASVPLNTPSQLILTVKATDSDSEANGLVEYSLASNTSADSLKYFRIDPTSGGMFSKMTLNSPGLHSILVIATDSAAKASSRLSSTGVVEITIGSREANLFEFDQTSYTADIDENSRKGTNVTTVTARFSSVFASQSTEYSFASGNENNAFSINPRTGIINVNNPGPLDYETTPNMRLIVRAKDGNSHAYATLAVNLKDKNDNSPKFSQSKYVSAIWENNEPQTFVTQIVARDLDSGRNGLISYTIIGGDEENVFEIKYPYTGIIQTQIDAAPLDRDSRPGGYRLIIEARDNGFPMRSSNCILAISIVDENDTPPLFPSIGPRNVSEDREVGFQVAMVTANDVDLNSVLVYDFTTDGNPHNTFSLDRSSGGLSLAKPLDYEDITHYSVGIQVSDGKPDHTQTIWLDINVQDENDNAPQFAQSSYKVALPEQTEQLQPVVTVRATDKDSNRNAEISYSMASTPVESFFIDPDSGTIYTNRTIYYTSEQSIIQLVVIARDHGQPSQSAMVAVHIQITDVNKHTPYFRQPSGYTAHLSELAQKGHSVLNVTAIDEDKSERGESVDYDIFGHGKELFHIKQRTGEIIYNGGADYEAEGGKEYTLYVVATDRGTPPKNTSVPVTIYIDDENDNAPVFIVDRYIIHVDENYPAMQEFPGPILNATDADSGPNAELKFTITSGNTDGIFHNPNWKGSLMIVNGMALDYETQQSHRLILRAVDCESCPRSSVRLSAFVTVDIYVNDVNEFHPVFPVKHYLEDLLENSTINTVVFTAHAIDGDGGQAGIVEYSLMKNLDYEKFSIDKVTGEVKSQAVFDYENPNTKKSYNLRIVAREYSGHHDLADVTIRLVDRDENVPAFAAQEYSFEVPGSAKEGDFVGRVSASDNDAGEAGRLVYTFISPNPYFKIEPFSGNMTVAMTLHEEKSSNDQGPSRTKRALTSSREELVIQVSSGQPGSNFDRTSCVIAIDRACAGCAAPVGSLHSSDSLDGGILAGIVLACIIVIVITIVAIIFFVYHRRHPRKSVPNYSSDSTLDLEPPPCLPSDRAYVEVIRNTRHQQRSNLMASDTSDQSHNSASSGRGSAEAEEEDEEITRINSRTFMHSSQAFRQKAMPDSGIQHDDDTLSESTAQTHQEYLANLGIDTSKIGKPKAKHLGRSAESMHQFSDEGGGEGGVDTDFEKITDFETDEETLATTDLKGHGVSFLEPDTHNVGSLSNVINSEEVNSGSYNWDYLIDWGPQYQPLAHVFSEIAKLKDESIKPKKQPIKTVPQRQFSGMLKQPKVRTNPPPIITNAPPIGRVESNAHAHSDQNVQVVSQSQNHHMAHHHHPHHHHNHNHHRDHSHDSHHPQDQNQSGSSHPHYSPTHSNHQGGYSYHHHQQQQQQQHHLQQQQHPRSMPYQYQPLPQQQKQYQPPIPPLPPQRSIDNHIHSQYIPTPPSNPPPMLPDREQGQQSSSESRSYQASTTNISLPSMPRSPISYESSLTSAVMTPSLTPSLSPLATRSPSISPVVSSGHNTPGQNGNVPRSKTHSISSSSDREFTI